MNQNLDNQEYPKKSCYCQKRFNKIVQDNM